MRRAQVVAALLLPLALAACPAGPPLEGAMVAPDTVGPTAVRRLERMQEMANQGDWSGIRAVEVPACSGPRDAVCGSAHALRAQACRNLATPAAQDRRALLDCAVGEGNVALGAAEAMPADRTSGWRRGLAWSLFDRRELSVRPALCRDNAALREQADVLRQEQPSLADARFLAASARFAGAASCGTVPACPELVQAARLLVPTPGGEDPRWLSLAAAVRLQQTSQSCGGGT